MQRSGNAPDGANQEPTFNEELTALKDSFSEIAELSLDLCRDNLRLLESESKLSIKASIHLLASALICYFLATALLLSITFAIAFYIYTITNVGCAMLFFIGINFILLSYFIKRSRELSELIGLPKTLEWLKGQGTAQSNADRPTHYTPAVSAASDRL